MAASTAKAAKADDTAKVDDTQSNQERFGRHRRQEAHRAEGHVGNGEVANAEPGWEYFWFDPSGRKPGRIAQQRQRFITRGYRPCNGPLYEGAPREEYVPGCATAEIWRASPAVSADRFNERLDKAKALSRWTHRQASRLGRGWRPDQHRVSPEDFVPEGKKLSDFPD